MTKPKIASFEKGCNFVWPVMKSEENDRKIAWKEMKEHSHSFRVRGKKSQRQLLENTLSSSRALARSLSRALSSRARSFSRASTSSEAKIEGSDRWLERAWKGQASLKMEGMSGAVHFGKTKRTNNWNENSAMHCCACGATKIRGRRKQIIFGRRLENRKEDISWICI